MDGPFAYRFYRTMHGKSEESYETQSEESIIDKTTMTCLD